MTSAVLPEHKGVWRTLRFRFALWVAGVLLAVLLVSDLFVYVSQARSLAAMTDDSLRLTATQTIAALSIENGHMDLSEGIAAEFADTAREHGLTIRLLSANGNVLQSFGLYRALPVTAAAVSAAAQQQATFATLTDPKQGHAVRFYTAPIIENNAVIGIVQVAQARTTAQETLSNLLTALLVSLPLLVVAAGLGGYFLAARALAPIDQMTRIARRISAENLSARLNLPATDDEVGRLANTFDMMLARLDESFRRERQFVADASHELRTPLAAMQAILSVIREKRRTVEDYEQAMNDLTEEVVRLRGLAANLLQLARADTQLAAVHEKVDLSNLLGDVTESLRPLADAKGLRLTCSTAEGLAVIGDSDNLIRLFVNLLDNAIKFTEHGSITLAAIRDRAGTLKVTIADTGVGVSPEHLPHLFDRFYRVDPSRTTPGSGLGLAIAQEITRAHSGTIEVSSVMEQGTVFTVRLPGPSHDGETKVRLLDRELS